MKEYHHQYQTMIQMDRLKFHHQVLGNDMTGNWQGQERHPTFDDNSSMSSSEDGKCIVKHYKQQGNKKRT